MSATTPRSRGIGIALLSLLAGLSGRAVAQDGIIRGTVRSESGALVPGAHVTIPELAIETSTAASGRYEVAVARDLVRGQTVVVRVRREGYRSRTEALVLRSGEQALDVTLERDPNGVEALVSSGVLDSTPRMATTVTVARVDAADLPVPGVSPAAQLAGHVPGLVVFSPSGRPGTAPEVLVRGPTSLNATSRSQEPLYIIDGVIVSGGLAAIDPQDIATFEVVRGAAGASLYGARGANGVVTITTRSGPAAPRGATFGLRSEAGVSDVEHAIHLARQHALLLSADGRRFCVRNTAQPLCAQSVDWIAETDRVNNAPGNWADLPVTFAFDPGSGTYGAPLRQVFLSNLWPVPTYDPVRQVLISKPYASTSMDLTSGTADARYFAGVTLLRQQGAIRYLDGLTRYTARLNVDQRLGANLSLSLRTFYSRGYVDGATLGANLFFRLTRQPAAANLLARDALGRLYVRSNIMTQGDQNNNPLMYTTGNGVTDNETSNRFISGGTLRWAVAPWADLEANFSYDSRSSHFNYQEPTGFRIQSINWRGDDEGFDSTSTSGGESYNASVTLTLRHRLLPDLGARWTFRSLVERQDTNYRSFWGDSLAFRGVEAGANITGTPRVSSSFTSERLAGLLAGVSLDFRQKLFGDVLVRRDGSSLFGSGNRWVTFGRAALAYRPSQERWWRWPRILNEFKLRASYGTAGGRPSFAAQYETFSVGTGGTLSPAQLANPNLRPETTTELSLGADMELFRRVGVTVTYAHSDTKDQILPASIPYAMGFGTQWRNVGTLTNKTWELSVQVPLVRTHDLTWLWRFNYDRTRTVVTKLDVPPFRIGTGQQGATDIINIAEDERYGTMYGRYMLRGTADCARLPAAFQSSCGSGAATDQFQVNSDGWLVWTAGHGVGEGLTRNLWMTQLPAARAPWGIALNWGMPITLRDSLTHSAASVPLGTGLPDWRFSISQTLQYRRLTVYALLEGVMGRAVWNEGRHWSYLDFINRDMDQRGRDPGVAKPIGYYYRASPPDHASGINGFYQTLSPNNETVEDASFAKLRELAVTYHIGQVGGVGNWDVSLIGRNVFTLTRYTGFDPETGIGGGTANSGLVNAVDAYTFPNTRTLTVALATRF